MAFQKISTKILIALLIAGLVPFAISVITATLNSKTSLTNQTYAQLTAVRDIKMNALDSYLHSIENQLINLATNETVIESMDGFALNYPSFGGSEDGMDEGDSNEVDQQRKQVQTYWQQEFAKEYTKQSAQTPNIEEWTKQLSNQAIRFQFEFIANNPNPLGQKNALNKLENKGLYGYNKFHNSLHPWLNDYLQRFGFYDIFLVDNSGNVVYSVYKETDFATNLKKGPWKDSGLAKIYDQAQTLEVGQAYISDLELYEPSYQAPASFAATPIFKTNRQGKPKKIGTLIFQMPLDKFSQIMEQRSGLGQTGETYLVGKDGLIRSNSFTRPDTHNVVNAFRNPDATRINSDSWRSAVNGETGEKLIERDGHSYLSAYAPFQVLGLDWVILAEIETSEALSAIIDLEWQMTLLSLIMIAVILAFGKYLSTNLSRPILDLANLMNQVKRDFKFSHRYQVQSKDEIGQAATAFNELLNATEEALNSVNATMQQIAKGNFEQRVQTPLEGDLAILKTNVNNSAQSVQTTMHHLGKVMDSIVHGNFSLRLGNDIKGEFRDKVNQALEVIETAIQEVGDVVYSLSQGNLDKRVTSNLEGDLLKLKEHTNTSIERLEMAFDAITDAAVAQSKGDLTVQIQQEMHGDLDKLKQAFNHSSASLNTVISQVIQTANTVTHASQEVGSGNHDLNNRTQAQAASLEETAAAMEELTSTIQHNNQNAQNADQLAKQAMHQTELGQQVMAETEKAINDIHNSSKQIEEITGLIDSIAFQTNLLALNAAVEAARAGDHGRGFAVVAGEVRNLAGKSAEAAKSISTLIENTVKSIEKGTEKISETGESLRNINQSITEVAQRVAEISAASQEQQQGIVQINHAISDIDNGTQQNAALVEETTAAAESLVKQSNDLRNAVSRFKVSNHPIKH